MSRRSIKHYLIASWMCSLLLAVGASAALSFAISYLDYSNHRQAIETKLRSDAQIIARRTAAELLLGENGRLEAVRTALASEFKLTKLEISGSLSNPSVNGTILVSERIPGISRDTFVHLAAPAPRFAHFINIRNLLFALIPILALVLFGIFIQGRLLHRYITGPVQALAQTSAGAMPVKDHWPIEIQTIARELAESFSSREQAIFGQLSQGLIHDIRTLINPINSALQLVDETNPGTPERLPRLENLQTACARNIPKIRDLLDLSLDSSREIVVRPKPSDITHTLQQSIQNVRDLAESKHVSITSMAIDSLNFSHDRIQMERVLTNLIKNAVEAVEPHSQQLKRVVVSTDLTQTGLDIRIEDSGPGFADSKHLFRPLKTTKTHGYGLGLFVSRKIVEAHLGELKAEQSERLGGAKLTVFLPNKPSREDT